MSIISGVTVTWGTSPRVITIPTSYGTAVLLDNLLDTVQDIEYSETGMAFPKLRDASGKEALSATELVGLTIKLLNAKVKFQDRASPTDCDIFGGNLTAVDANNQLMNPIQYATNVTVGYAKSTSAAMVQSVDITSIKAKTDSLPSDPAKESTLAGKASQTTVQGIQDAIGTPSSTVFEHLGIIQGKTDTLPSNPASESSVQYIRSIIGTPTSPTIAHDLDTIETKINLIPTNPATETTLTAIKGSGWSSETLKFIKELVESTRRGQIIVR